MQIIPALIADDADSANDFEEIKSRFDRIAPFLAELGGWIQLDITDGKFVPTMTHLSWEQIRFFTERAKTDLHLMIKEPEAMIGQWIATGPKRITLHIEATKNPEKVIAACRAEGIEVGIALNPETPVSQIANRLSQIDLLLFLGVNPGRGGQKFIPEVLEKIKALPRTTQEAVVRGLPPVPKNVKIGVDGGINDEAARRLKEFNVDVLVAGSYLFSGDIEPKIKVLSSI
ncbi:ribulose-phosphate 3-epimerase [Candidatus Wolfebacteria bacterium]|nr:ribulose-phosphate 3-epimerase [Candidatus Wolfebacteria bacterium]